MLNIGMSVGLLTQSFNKRLGPQGILEASEQCDQIGRFIGLWATF